MKNILVSVGYYEYLMPAEVAAALMQSPIVRISRVNSKDYKTTYYYEEPADITFRHVEHRIFPTKEAAEAALLPPPAPPEPASSHLVIEEPFVGTPSKPSPDITLEVVHAHQHET